VALHLFLNHSQKDLAGMNLPDFRHKSINNVLARALELGKTRQWPAAG
jgi:hypothetical protein